jgi:hypothetical protein
LLLIKGTVIFVHRNFDGADPDYYKIKGEDGNEYFAHMGDVDGNEKILYEAHNKKSLVENESVEFDSIEITSPRAIHIKKTNKHK